MVGWKWFCEELELLKSQKKQLQKESNEKVEMGNEIWIHIHSLVNAITRQELNVEVRGLAPPPVHN